ncbi:MAG: molybdopterin molybdenumtransferase MoeA [Granulosicoccus sp.]|nr:molybdopterin molybdenumtransferase MoeA [Granulosicoccus sp.]
MIERQSSCDDALEPSLLPVEEARRRLFSSLQVVDELQNVYINKALGRVLAADVISPLDVPAQANSAMDGYAISRSSIPNSGEASLAVIGTAWAGQPFSGHVGEGEAVRIFTGGIMPEGTDTVVIQEHVRLAPGDSSGTESIDVDCHVVPGKNVRQAGEDVTRGQAVLQGGRKLQAADIGILASLGIHRVEVIRPLEVAFFTTGDELQSLDEHAIGTDLEPGKLFDSNRYTLAALLAGLQVNVIDMGIVRDDETETRRVLQAAAASADVVITSGGVSAGEADFVTRVFHELGEVSFWKLAMRPGRPLAYGHIGKAAFFGLPGNPVAVMVTFLEFVQPALKYLSGMRDIEPLMLPARCLSRLRKPPGRVEYQRGVMSLDNNGELTVESTGKQGAGRLSSMSKANCLIVIASEADGVLPGDRVHVQPFHGLLPG